MFIISLLSHKTKHVLCFAIEVSVSLIHSACYTFEIEKNHFFLSDVTVVLCLKIPQKDAGIATSSRTGTQFACCSVRSVLSSNTMETELRMNKLKTPVPIIAGLCVYLYCKIYHTTKVPVCCWSPSPCSGAQIPASCVVVCDWLIPQ